VFAIPFFLLILSLLLAIFVIDFENQIIPDELVFSAIVVILFVKILASQTVLYVNLLTAFSAAVFLLGINLATRGKGMGLGDVKLALLGGLLLSWPVTATWLYLSFIIGAITGIVLILAKKAKFGKQIAFGPFLIISLFISLAAGYRISELLFAFLP
jgi:prepilin signal peptidase PulO-like enzyme (type II secretory pathway)